MPAHKKLIDEIKQALNKNADAKAALQMQAYMKSTLPFYGVNTPTMRAICKSVFAAHPLNSFEHWRDTVLSLWRAAKYREEKYCAIQLCEAKHYDSYQTLETIPLYEEMIVTGAWWDYVDVIASHRIGHLLRKFPRKMKPLLKRWAKDPDMWKRRTAIISQLSFKDETDLNLLYACIKPSLASKEFFLQKAIGWALRSYAWHDLDTVMAYVEQHRQQLSPLSQREALKNQHKLRAKPRRG